MSDLFLPEKQEEWDLLRPKVIELGYEEDQVMVFSMGVNIYFLPRLDLEPMLFARRSGVVRDFCMHDGRLLDAGNYDGIKDTLTGDDLIDTKEYNTAIASHFGRVYRASFGMILDVDNTVSFRDEQINCFCEYDKELYDSGTSGVIYNTFKDHYTLLKAEDNILDLEVHGDRLYHCSQNGVFDSTLGHKMGDQAHITSLCSYGGRLYGGSYRKITDIFSGVDVYNWGEGFFNCIISVPKSSLEDYLK